MARRMLSLDIIDTDAFLDMPLSSQVLYFHLNARADDDGFVANPKKIMRMLGTQTDDYKVLLTKKFIIAFDDGVCVIKHWRINNFIRKDIYKETKYLDLKSTLFIRPNGVYTQNSDKRGVAVPSGHFQLDSVNASSTTRQHRKGKVRIGKVSKPAETSSADKTSKYNPLGSEIIKLFEDINPVCKRYYGNTTQRQACDDLLENYGLETVSKVIKVLPQTNRMQYFSTVTTPLQLRDKWESLKSQMEKKKSELSKKSKVHFS